MNIESMQRYSEVDLFSVEGRMGRKVYFFYSIVVPFIFFWIFASIAGIIAKLGDDANFMSYVLLGLAVLMVLFMVLHLTIQRCHDFNASGWLAVLALIPFANIIFSMIPGDNRLNSYGEIPEPASGFITSGVVIIIALLTALVVFSLLYFFNINVRDYIF
jgi:uncharacterized membrane protein YhaH (DUF805 family)